MRSKAYQQSIPTFDYQQTNNQETMTNLNFL